MLTLFYTAKLKVRKEILLVEPIPMISEEPNYVTIVF